MEHTKHIVVIGGSVREGNYTNKALAIVEDELKKQRFVTFEMVDPAKLILPLPGQFHEKSSHDQLQKMVKNATGIILASPEYHGGVSSVMKLVIDNLGFPSILSGKPISLLGVAAGRIGAIKSLEQLRSICSHVGAMVLPGTISIASVNKVFTKEGVCTDPAAEKQIRSVVTNLISYIDNHICPKIALENLVREEKSEL